MAEKCRNLRSSLRLSQGACTHAGGASEMLAVHVGAFGEPWPREAQIRAIVLRQLQGGRLNFDFV